MTCTAQLCVGQIVATLPGTLLLFAYALLFALVEIEIEGKDGWAINLPTWFRRGTRVSSALCSRASR